MELFPLSCFYLAEHQDETFGSNERDAVFVVRFSLRNPSLGVDGGQLALGRAFHQGFG